jgi:hypothetical protein
MKTPLRALCPKPAAAALFLLSFLFLSISGFSQNVGISAAGSPAPNANAGLDVNYTSKGLLIPRVALTTTAAATPLDSFVAGMLVYNTATASDVKPGFYYSDGTRWIASIPVPGSAGDMQYWDGTQWVTIPVGTPGQFLKVGVSGTPVWAQ